MTLAKQGCVSLPDGAGLQTRVFLASGFGSVMGSLPLSRQGKRQTPTPRFGRGEVRERAYGFRHKVGPLTCFDRRVVRKAG